MLLSGAYWTTTLNTYPGTERGLPVLVPLPPVAPKLHVPKSCCTFPVANEESFTSKQRLEERRDNSDNERGTYRFFFKAEGPSVRFNKGDLMSLARVPNAVCSMPAKMAQLYQYFWPCCTKNKLPTYTQKQKNIEKLSRTCDQKRCQPLEPQTRASGAPARAHDHVDPQPHLSFLSY
jgi:hypothetical protein